MQSNSSCDNIIDNYMGYGKYHKITFFIIGLIILADGSEALALSLMLPCIIKEWNLDGGIKKIVSSIYYVGVLIGALIGGILADKYGRKSIFIITAFLTAILGFSAYLIHDIYIFMLVRGSFGILIGIVSPLSVCFITEVFPSKMRGQWFIYCRIGKMIGEFLAALVGLIFLDKTFTRGNWRALLLVSALPAFLSFFLAKIYLYETPRYLLSKIRFEESYDVMKKIRIINGNLKNVRDFQKDENLLSKNFEDLNSMTQSQKKLIELKYKELSDISEFPNNRNTISSFTSGIISLFKPELRRVTILVWLMWFCMTFIFYGQTFILPIIISMVEEKKEIFSNNQGESFWDLPFLKIISPILAEIPASIFCGYIIEYPNLGRKWTIFYAFVLSGICFFFCFFSGEFFLVLNLTFARFLLVIGYSVKYTYTAEIYKTTVRSSGVGAASAFGRFGGIIMPWVLLSAIEQNVYYPFIAFFAVSCLGSISTYLFPYDTFNKELDTDSLIHNKL